jgi:predicted transcriptional regulator
MNITVKNSSASDFFVKGKKIARTLDQNKTLSQEESLVISFEKLEDFLNVLTPSRLKLYREVHKKPQSIQELIVNLERKPMNITKDIYFLEKMGILEVVYTTNQLQNTVRTATQSMLKLQIEL